MPFTFDSAVGSTTANSFVSVEFADEYIGGKLYATDWPATSAGADLLKKQQALVDATRVLNALQYQGTKTATTQRLKHPRYDLPDDNEWYFSSTEIALPLMEATCELALSFLQTDPASVVDESLKQFKSLSLPGGLRLDLRDDLPSESELPAHVRKLVSPLLAIADNSIRLLRG